MAYTPTTKYPWANWPSTTTLVEAADLAHIEDGIGATYAGCVSITDKAYGAVGDGVTDDTAAIQAAITAAAVSGLDVRLPAGGIYYVTTLVPSSNVRVWGYGATLKKNASSDHSIFSNRDLQVAVSNIGFYGITFTGEGQGYATADRRGAIGLYNVTNVTVRDCTVTDMAYQGIALSNAVGVRIQDNTLTHVCAASQGNAIHVSISTGAFTPSPVASQDVRVTGNTVSGCHTAGVCIQDIYSLSGYGTYPPYNVRVDHNNLSTDAFAAIALEIGLPGGGTSTAGFSIRQVSIDHNICTQLGSLLSPTCYGIAVNDTSGGTYSSDSAEFQDIIIDHNIVNSADGGILCQASYTQIDHNNIVAASSGILISSNSVNTPTGQSVAHNIVRMVTGNTSDGIQASNVDSPSISENKIVFPSSNTSTRFGIYVNTCTRPNVQSNSIRYAPGDGIRLSASPDLRISGNRIYNPSTHIAGSSGIWILNCTNSTLMRGMATNNDISDDRGSPLMLFGIGRSGGTPRMCYADNNIWGNTGGPISDTSPTVMRDTFAVPTGTYPINPTSITVTGSPFTYLNSDPYPLDVVVQGGTVSKIEKVHNANFVDSGVTAGIFHLEQSESLKVTYTGTPTMTKFAKANH